MPEADPQERPTEKIAGAPMAPMAWPPRMQVACEGGGALGKSTNKKAATMFSRASLQAQTQLRVCTNGYGSYESCVLETPCVFKTLLTVRAGVAAIVLTFSSFCRCWRCRWGMMDRAGRFSERSRTNKSPPPLPALQACLCENGLRSQQLGTCLCQDHPQPA